MDKFLTSLVVGVLATALVFLLVILGTCIGALGGWVVGWFFGETILGVLAAFGVTGIKMWQFGAFLGFVGGFFRASQTNNS